MSRILILVLLFLSIGRVEGQEPVIRTQTTVVLAPTLVKNAKGNIVYGLHAEDFAIEDDGVAQTVQLDEVLDTQPVSLVVVVQRGGSVFPELSRMQGLGTMLDPALDQGKTEIAIVEFDSKVSLESDFTNNEAAIRSDLKNLRPGDGGAAILDAVNYSVKLLDKMPNDRLKVLLLISETQDHGSALKLTDVATTIANSNIVMYTLAFSPALSMTLDWLRGRYNDAPPGLEMVFMGGQAMKKNIPKAIASMTGGEYELFKSGKGFDVRMNEFDNHLYNRYLLSFEPKNPHPGLHQIQVKLQHSSSATVLARDSYWVAPILPKASPSK